MGNEIKRTQLRPIVAPTLELPLPASVAPQSSPHWGQRVSTAAKRLIGLHEGEFEARPASGSNAQALQCAQMGATDVLADCPKHGGLVGGDRNCPPFARVSPRIGDVFEYPLGALKCQTYDVNTHDRDNKTLLKAYVLPNGEGLALDPGDLPAALGAFRSGQRQVRLQLVPRSKIVRDGTPLAKREAISFCAVRIWQADENIEPELMSKQWRSRAGAETAPSDCAENVWPINNREIELVRAREIPKGDHPTALIHASPESFGYYDSNNEGQDISASKVAEKIIAKGYSGGPLRLIACLSGARDDGPAQQLADALAQSCGDVEIIAPTTREMLTPDGAYYPMDSGHWRTFRPTPDSLT